jgi:phage/plasmid-like protein (TIGR03299 family)
MAKANTDRIYHMGHGYGTQFREQPTVEEAMRVAGINREIIKRPIAAVVDEKLRVPFEAKAMTLERQEDGSWMPLGIVGRDYSICQNSNAMLVAMELERQGKFKVQSVARLKNGARVVMTGKVDEHAIKRLDGADDVMSSHFVFANAHDAQGSVIMGMTHLRHICNNQNVAMMKGLRHEIRMTHVGDLESRVAEAQSLLLEGEDQLHKARKVFQKLAETRVTRSAYRKFAAKLLDGLKGTFDEGDGRKNARTTQEARQRTIAELEAFFVNGRGNTGETKWDAFNSVTEWLDGKLDRLEEAKRTASRFTAHYYSSAFGENRSAKGRALRLLTAK